jgi:hypothetical protein
MDVRYNLHALKQNTIFTHIGDTKMSDMIIRDKIYEYATSASESDQIKLCKMLLWERDPGDKILEYAKAANQVERLALMRLLIDAEHPEEIVIIANEELGLITRN